MEIAAYAKDENKLYKIAFVLAIVTIIFSVLEGSFSVFYGYESSSLTLFGNGVISFIEVVSGFGVAVMTLRIMRRSKEEPAKVERTALRITGTGQYLLAGGLVITSIGTIITHRHPTTTLSGIIIGAITIAVIGSLVVAKMNVGKHLNSRALIADAKCTRICVSMSTMVLVTSIVYELTTFEYADAIGAIGLAYFAYREARECFAFN
jgi:divalent metal cation (Fe/Co/Zn/Cd) transporter